MWNQGLHTQNRYGFLLSVVENIRTAVCFVFEYSTDIRGLTIKVQTLPYMGGHTNHACTKLFVVVCCYFFRVITKDLGLALQSSHKLSAKMPLGEYDFPHLPQESTVVPKLLIPNRAPTE